MNNKKIKTKSSYTYEREPVKYHKVRVMFRKDENGGHPHLIYRIQKDGTIISVGLTHNYRKGKYSSTYLMSRDPLKEPSYIKDCAIKDKKGAYRKDKKCSSAYLSDSDYEKFKKSIENYYKSRKK